MFPLVVDLTDRPVVVIGAGKVGVRKAAQLLEAGALVTVITDVVLAPVPDGVAALHIRSYRYGDLEGALLVVAATGDPDVNDRIVAEANERNILLNVVDDLSRSNFYFTGGSSPALAQWVRNSVAKALPRDLASVARALRAERSALHDAGESTENREWMQRVNQLVDEL